MSKEQQQELSTVASVVDYLSQTPFASDNVQSLSGGSANFVYRIHLRTPHDGASTVVLKYAAPYVAMSATKMPFAVERQNFEVQAIKALKTILPGDSIVTVPTIHYFDADAHILIMNDCGDGILTLKDLMLQDPPPTSVAHSIGTELGAFLGRLHTWGLDRDASNHEFFDKNQQGRMISGFVTYGRLVSTLTGKDNLPALADSPLGIPESKIDIISTLVPEKIETINTSHETLTMGDFWPGNILIQLKPGNGDDTVSLERIHILDWELSKPGLAGLDVGQFSAEMHLLRRFSPACNESVSVALVEFMRSYRRSFAVDVELAKVAAVHVGAHLVAWTPRVPWGSKERVREVVTEGVDLLVGGYVGEREWLDQSLVGPLLS